MTPTTHDTATSLDGTAVAPHGDLVAARHAVLGPGGWPESGGVT